MTKRMSKEQLSRFGIFSVCNSEVHACIDSREGQNNDGTEVCLVSLTTNDVATDLVQKDLLTAKAQGQELIETFMNSQLV